MNLVTRKSNFIQELSNIDESLLEKLELLVKASKKDWYSELSAQEKEEIEIGISQADNNELVSHSAVMDKFKKWH
ncbi:hypothetical protein [Flavobacterium laiguense]|uniref:Uncharacterized protein n=1 Tax=Flavobacterium laiguense TaxID=2169409 RepID=A0A2U1JRZ3_9FLAO|nr:hypothetical protein [Flavobacterium laiguense]PWA07980.1 hypothetical protein DB891_13300 [Flavobacterium laiguense]